MSKTLDELVPDYLQQPLIKLTPSDPLSQPQARRPTTVLVDASACLPAGLMLPIEILVTGPSPKSFLRKLDERFIRQSFTFTPREGGRFTVVVREVAHNLWWGSLDLDVAGDSFDDMP